MNCPVDVVGREARPKTVVAQMENLPDIRLCSRALGEEVHPKPGLARRANSLTRPTILLEWSEKRQSTSRCLEDQQPRSEERLLQLS